MFIESEDRLTVAADRVYELVRDRQQELVPYLPNVEEIVELSRERESAARLRVVNRWRAKVAIPSVAARFLPDDLFSWTDHALWKDDENCVDFALDGFGYDVRGTNRFVADGDGTVIHVTATVTIHPETFNVPRLLFGTVFPAVEGAVRRAIEPNLTALASGLRAYFADRD